MPIRTRPRTPRRWLPAGLMAAALAAGPLLAAPAAAAPVVMVRCPDQDLQTAINSAAPGSMLLVSGTCTGRFRITRPLTLMGIGLDPTLDGKNSGTVVTVLRGVEAELSGLTITRGKAPEGAGIDNTGRLTLTRSTVTGNTASNRGGGVYSTGTLTLFRSTVTGNNSTDGGGIYNAVGGTATLNLSEVNGNTAAHFGGGIFNRATMTLTGSTVNGNRSGGEGGGIYNSGRVTLTRSTVSGNVPDNCYHVPGCTG